MAPGWQLKAAALTELHSQSLPGSSGGILLLLCWSLIPGTTEQQGKSWRALCLSTHPRALLSTSASVERHTQPNRGSQPDFPANTQSCCRVPASLLNRTKAEGTYSIGRGPGTYKTSPEEASLEAGVCPPSIHPSIHPSHYHLPDWDYNEE